MFWVSFLLSFGGSLLLVPLIRWISLRLGKTEKPREDRWHNRPIPTLGGVGIYLGFLFALVGTKVLGIDPVEYHWGLVIGSGLIFFLGLIDDFSPLTPPAKLVGQILAASTVIFLGYSTNFFTPRISNEILAQLLNTLLTFLWIIGITNAVNLLDNMDGLAGGIATISAMILAFLFWRGGATSLMVFALALGGVTLGFLVFNFPPAKIFMGDSGSQFLGFSLAVLAIARQPQASNVFAILGVPTLVFLLPILDTTFVTITRLLRGQSPVRGGRDHTSHRLVAFGLSERQALAVLYGVAITSGVIGITIETLDYWLSLVLVPVLVISLALFAAYFSRIKVVETVEDVHKGSFISLLVNLTYKRRLFEIILDFFLIGTAYYLAFWTNYGLSVPLIYLENYLRSLPIAFAGAYLSFFLFGVYRGLWRYIGIDDLLRYAKATLAGVTILVLTHQLLPEIGRIVPEIFILFSLFLFLGLAMTRSSFKVLDQVFGQHTRLEGERILILGGGDSGEMALRWILMNPDLGYNPVGILDGNPLNTGRHVHGVTILGDYEKLAKILGDNSIDGVVITGNLLRIDEQTKQILSVCKGFGCWVRVLRLEFELLEGNNEFHSKYPGT